VIGIGFCHASLRALAFGSPPGLVVVDDVVVVDAGCASPVIFSFIFFFKPPNCALEVAGADSAAATASNVKLQREP
jgi:hypothetical protein